MQPWIMPKIVPHKDTGNIITSSQRANRFNVSFSLGSMGSCAVDAEALVKDAMDNLVNEIKALWSQSRSADGTRLPERKVNALGPIYYGSTWEFFASKEAEVLKGTYRIGRRTKKITPIGRRNIEKQKQFVKETKKKYKWNGRTYIPNAENRPGIWSGLLLDSLTAERVVIRQRNGKIPTKVRCRLTVAPSRGEIVVLRKMNAMSTNSPAFVKTTGYMADATKKTTQFKSYRDSNDMTMAKLISLYNSYRRSRKMMSKILSTASRFI